MKKFLVKSLVISALILAISPEFTYASEQKIEFKEQIFQFENADKAHAFINQKIRQNWLNQKLEHQKDFDRQFLENKKDLLLDKSLQFPDWTLACETIVYANTPKFFSARNSFGDYTGGAHGHCWTDSFNVVFENQDEVKELSFFDIFDESKKSEIATLLISEILTQVEGCWEKSQLQEMGTDGLLKEVCAFVFCKKGVEIFFNKYSVACGASGNAPILIEYKKLSKITLPYLQTIEQELLK